MPYLQDEKTRLLAEMQAAAAETTTLTTQLGPQQQAMADAQTRLSAAQTRLTAAQTQLAGLEAAAATADQRVGYLNNQIELHRELEPIGEPGAPVPVAVYRRWYDRLLDLNDQHYQAEAAAATAHAHVDNGRAAVSQVTAEVQAAASQVAAATAAVQATQLAIEAARKRQETARTQVANLDRWNEEIARDPLARKTLEQVAAELSDQTAVLEEAYAEARVQHEILEETLASLSARRDQLIPALNDVHAQLPAAQTELQAASAALAVLASRIETLFRRGPLG
jgi:chromosome segregation ATPase